MVQASISLYGTTIGAAAWQPENEAASFEYAESFLNSGIEVAPLMMPLRKGAFSFPSLPKETFKGLPGLLADALPDKFGNLLIDQWLARQNRTPESFTPIDRLCYLGNRAMGALEFEPTMQNPKPDQVLEIASLVELANAVLQNREALQTTLISDHEKDALADILRVGTSAGGARAKAVIAWNPKNGQIRSGQVKLPKNFEHWLLKFDGVSGNADKELADPMGFGRIEYAYHLMALEAGITMNPCRLLEENGRAHFMTQRFDRTDDGDKLHLQTLCALGHYDFNQAGGYSYEQAFQIARQLNCGQSEIIELYRRAAFNILARNQDDHTKNISFLMNRRGVWSLAPAYDVTYSYNPSGAWTSSHQMTFNGKRDAFTKDDLFAAGKSADLKPRQIQSVLEQIDSALNAWRKVANRAEVSESNANAIEKQFRRIL